MAANEEKGFFVSILAKKLSAFSFYKWARIFLNAYGSGLSA
jgi:hypothetical protein